jgi:hypothetical protein
LANFNCGEPTLDEWLRKRVLRNAELAATKTYVICPTGSYQVVGYYAVCMGQILQPGRRRLDTAKHADAYSGRDPRTTRS